MTAHYLNKQQPLLGSYEVYGGSEGFRWTWRETAKDVAYVEHGIWRASASDAWRDAADDWEDNGDARDKRFAGRMRATATRLEKEG